MRRVKKDIVIIRERATSRSKVRVVDKEEFNRVENAQDALVAILSVITELGIESKLEVHDEAIYPEDEIHVEIPAESYFVGSLEVVWSGKIERVVLPLPLEIKHIPEITKTKFKDAVDLTTTEKR